MTVDPASTYGDVAEFVHGYLAEDEVLVAARARGEELGAAPVTEGTGAALRFVAAAAAARAVVEVGTGAGVSGLYLLDGMADGGVLTTIDVEPEHHRAAKRAFADAGYPPGRTRLIMGRALDVLPRLTDAGYDVVFVDAAKAEYPRYYEAAVRLLRPGGVIAFDRVLSGGRVADPARRDTVTSALRELANLVREDERMAPAVVPIADGMLVAAKRG